MNVGVAGRFCLLLSVFTLATGCSVAASDDGTGDLAETSQALSRRLSVDFETCREMASLTPVPLANVRSRVPSSYAIANEAAGTVFIVVRIAQCANVKIDGRSDGAGIVAQVGVNLVSPDGTGDINNYTLEYYTTSPRLFGRLRGAGVTAAQFTRDISFDVSSAGQLAIGVGGCPSFTLSGPVVPPTSGPVPFVANWWQDSRGGRTTRMNTLLPNIKFSSATLALSTPAGSDLAAVLGATNVTFPIFDSYNTFQDAHMEVTVSR